MEEILEKVARYAEEFARSGVYGATVLAEDCQSPIEVGFLVSLITVVEHQGHSVFMPPDDFVFKIYEVSRKTLIRPQFVLDPYRVDFAIRRSKSGRKSRTLIVECDGHDFHERTKEQAARDRARDRDIQARGFTVFRFTGAEIWRDPIKCAESVFDWLEAEEMDDFIEEYLAKAGELA